MLDQPAAVISIRDSILQQITEIAQQQHKTLAALHDDLPLLESGLDSLCIAVLVANLDDQLDLDPFGTGQAGIPVTVGDFIAMYENAAVG
jgi:aryl carrier-like protein